LGALKRIELLDIPVEQFFALICFEKPDVLEEVLNLISRELEI